MPFATTLPRPDLDAGPGPSAAPASRPSAPPDGGLEEKIHGWLRESFAAIQASWSSGSLPGLEPYVSAALGGHLARELAALRRDGTVNRVEEARLLEVTLLSTDGGAPVIEIVFSARDWIADLASGAVVDGDPNRASSFRQRWYLLPDGPGRWRLDEVEPR